MLLDALQDASAGLRRELALPTTISKPADSVAAATGERPGVRGVPARALADDDPQLLDQLLAAGLARVHGVGLLLLARLAGAGDDLVRLVVEHRAASALYVMTLALRGWLVVHVASTAAAVVLLVAHVVAVVSR